ncbi:hypothetical protein ELB75_07645 [Eikenella corrodens]|uniref:Uncharacterized protein n=1 Tax=Eikenella corrodens TaxID=539 RepID=A0A3S9SK87_EIKCO|nr:hypothetical protein ELB75_07645 [Eikenella corrodens]
MIVKGVLLLSDTSTYLPRRYSELNLNQYSVGSPCRNVCTVCGSPPCPDLNLIHYIAPAGKYQKTSKYVSALVWHKAFTPRIRVSPLSPLRAICISRNNDFSGNLLLEAN